MPQYYIQQLATRKVTRSLTLLHIEAGQIKAGQNAGFLKQAGLGKSGQEHRIRHQLLHRLQITPGGHNDLISCGNSCGMAVDGS